MEFTDNKFGWVYINCGHPTKPRMGTLILGGLGLRRYENLDIPWAFWLLEKSNHTPRHYEFKTDERLRAIVQTHKALSEVLDEEEVEYLMKEILEQAPPRSPEPSKFWQY